MSMSKYSYECNLSNGYEVDPTSTSTVGYILSGTLSGEKMNECYSIVTPKGDQKDVVAIMTFADWPGKQTKPVQFSFGVNDALDGKLTAARSSKMKTDIELEFVVFQYDHTAKDWYEAFYSDGAPLKGGIVTRDVATKETENELYPQGLSRDLQDPRTHVWQATVKAEGEQIIGAASSVGDKWKAKIGVNQK